MSENAESKGESGLSTDEDAALGTIAEWVEAFRAKRQQIVDRRCA
jgi:hypothetical protein